MISTPPPSESFAKVASASSGGVELDEERDGGRETEGVLYWAVEEADPLVADP